MSRILTNEEVRKLQTDLHNTKKMYLAQRETNTKLREKVKFLVAKIERLETENKELKSKLTDFEYQLTQLKTIVFGKNRKIFKDEDDEPRTPIQRTADSYKRPIPKESEITETKIYTLSKNDNLQRVKTFYVEDIPLDLRKLVTKYEVTQEKIGGIWTGKIPVPTTEVTIGPNVIMMINTLTVEYRLPYSQIQSMLETFFHFHISQGEIANLIYKESLVLAPNYEQLKLSIQAESSQHLDESGWRVGRQKDFCWSMTGGESNSSIYKLGVSRGKGYAEGLLGLAKDEKLKSVLVSDDYPAYKNISEYHQLCWAHPIRKWRDLANHTEFNLKSQYSELKSIFHELKLVVSEINPLSKLEYFTNKLRVFSKILNNDPPAIIRLKKTFKENISKYLTCLKFPSIQLTNNTAERSLRSLVIKRNISFGSNTQRGADALSVTFTVIKELLRTNQGNFFEAYALARV